MPNTRVKFSSLRQLLVHRGFVELDMLAAEDADYLGWEGMEAYQDDEY